MKIIENIRRNIFVRAESDIQVIVKQYHLIAKHYKYIQMNIFVLVWNAEFPTAGEGLPPGQPTFRCTGVFAAVWY